MKKPVVDYRKVRLSNITSPEYKHLLLIIGWIAYFIAYFLTENLIPESVCHVIHTHMDDIIPFNEWFIVFYVGWYVLVFGTLLYFLLYDIPAFSGTQKFIITVQVIGVLFYIFYPSVQHLRPEIMPRENVATWLLAKIYAADTPTGVFPSMHVAYSLAVLSGWLKKKDAKIGFKIFVFLFVIGVCASVCFVKQHSFADIICALPVCLVGEIVAFGKSYWLPKFRKTPIPFAKTGNSQ